MKSFIETYCFHIEDCARKFMMVHGVPQLDLIVTQVDFEFARKYCSHRDHSDTETCPDTYMLSSIAKTFTAFSIINFSETLGISLTDPILDYLPQLAKCSNINRDVRVIDLLGHTGGVNSAPFNWTSIPIEYEKTGVLESFNQGAYCFSVDTQRLGHWSYSNISYDILGALIEATSGVSFSHFVTENIFHKLEMRDSHFDVTKVLPEKLCRPTLFDHGEVLRLKSVPNVVRHRPSAVVFSTAKDLAKWGRYAASRGSSCATLKSKRSTFDRMWFKRTSTGIDYCPHYGLGWFVGDWAANLVVGHGGRESGFNTLLLTYPDSEVSITILMNTHNANVIRLAAEISRFLIRAKMLKARPRIESHPSFFPDVSAL
jgi:CubicO group peptidase (beta-lactamase class C family)